MYIFRSGVVFFFCVVQTDRQFRIFNNYLSIYNIKYKYNNGNHIDDVQFDRRSRFSCYITFKLPRLCLIHPIIIVCKIFRCCYEFPWITPWIYHRRLTCDIWNTANLTREPYGMCEKRLPTIISRRTISIRNNYARPFYYSRRSPKPKVPIFRPNPKHSRLSVWYPPLVIYHLEIDNFITILQQYILCTPNWISSGLIRLIPDCL